MNNQLKVAYQMVENDLFNSFLKLKDGDSIRFGKLGKFKKKEIQAKSALDGETYLYVKFNFKMFTKLKSALDEQMIQKYKLKK
jgi:hypothetical protein